jgi:hypothetical protein
MLPGSQTSGLPVEVEHPFTSIIEERTAAADRIFE